MVKAKTTADPWQHLYRALLRSSAASVRFCRPAARNTRRYLRDEFARALVADEQVAAGPSSKCSTTDHNALSHDASTIKTIDDNSARGSKSSQSSLPKPLSAELLHRQTHNTLAFHLCASLLPSSTTNRRLDRTNVINAAKEDLAIEDAKSGSTNGGSRGNSWDTMHSHHPPAPANDTMNTPSTETDRPNRPTKANRLAHRVISNLSSLTYHHLSPHTQMQSRAHLKQNRARKPQKLSSLARVLGKIEADVSLEPEEASNGMGLDDMLRSSGGRANGGGGGEGGETMLNALHMKLDFLVPSLKPVRGPVSARLKEWDGQNSDRIASEGGLRQMESDLCTIEKLLEQHDAEANKGARKQQGMVKQVQQLKNEAEGLRRKIKAATRVLVQAEAKEELEGVAIGHLADLVAAAQESEQVMLGKERWMRRKRGEFLSP